MSQILVSKLSFSYEESYEEIFCDVSFAVDTEWKLGLLGRNGKGKTTFLNLLMDKYDYSGTITSSVSFEYFPFPVNQPERDTLEIVEQIYPEYEPWRLYKELNLMEVDAEVLYRPFCTLSNGERTKLLLAVLFMKEHSFLLIDEPTNHLDAAARESVSRYLKKKAGFILVSHDRYFLDECIDHVLSLNRNSIEVIQGNFSSWWENRKLQDEAELQQNEHLKKEVGRLKEAAKKTESWSDDVEKTKKGTRVAGLRPDRGHIGHKAAKLMKRAKSTEKRMETAVHEKEKLLKDLEQTEQLKILPLSHHKECLAVLEDAQLGYDKPVCGPISFEIRQGDRILLDGRNGSGKSTVIKAILGGVDAPVQMGGRIETAPGLVISYVAQDTSWLRGGIRDFTERFGLDGTLFRTILRKLDFERDHFEKEMQYYSEGQKKKILLAKSLCERAHLYIWDEPLNFIDIFSRMQLEELLLKNHLTMLFVEHDRAFSDQIATKRVSLYNHRTGGSQEE